MKIQLSLHLQIFRFSLLFLFSLPLPQSFTHLSPSLSLITPPSFFPYPSFLSSSPSFSSLSLSTFPSPIFFSHRIEILYQKRSFSISSLTFETFRNHCNDHIIRLQMIQYHFDKVRPVVGHQKWALQCMFHWIVLQTLGQIVHQTLRILFVFEAKTHFVQFFAFPVDPFLRSF